MNLKSINNKYLFSKMEATLPPPVYSIAAIGQFSDTVCLTFDDGPDPIYTPAILDVLAAYNAKATFFVLGEAAEKFPQLIKRVYAAGHTIGNHTYSHPNPWFTTEDVARHEVIKASAIIAQITGEPPRWFRPPYGRLRFAMRQQATLDNMTTILWNRSIIDWGLMGNAKGIRNRMQRIEAGDIVLMHDGQREHNRPDNLLRFLPGFLASLPARSLQARSLDQLCNVEVTI